MFDLSARGPDAQASFVAVVVASSLHLTPCRRGVRRLGRMSAGEGRGDRRRGDQVGRRVIHRIGPVCSLGPSLVPKVATVKGVERTVSVLVT